MAARSPEPPVKRQKLAYHHKHRLVHPNATLPSGCAEPALLPQQLLDGLLYNALKTIIEETAYRLDIEEPYIESLALESIRDAADEFVQNLSSKVRRSMQAARRNVPIPTDFESAFHALDVARPDDQLSSYHVQHELNRALLPTPPPDDEFHPDERTKMPDGLLGPELSRQADLKRFGFNTKALPALPSAHTYRTTDVFTEREMDSRKIREMATEEGKLGEQALRKLAGAVRLDTALSTDADALTRRPRRGRPPKSAPTLTEEAMFDETMRDLMARQGADDFELGPVVSSEKKYRMPDEGRVRRRPVVAAKPATATVQTSTSATYDLLPPPKPKASAPAPAYDQDMDIEL